MRARVERRPTTDDADARVRLCRETTDDVMMTMMTTTRSRAGAARFDRAAGGVHRRLKPPSARG